MTLSLFHIVHISFCYGFRDGHAILTAVRGSPIFIIHLSTYLRVRYLTLESKRIIVIISRTVRTLLHAISRTLFANFSRWIAKTERVLVDQTDLLLKTHRLGETRRGSEKLSNRQLTF